MARIYVRSVRGRSGSAYRDAFDEPAPPQPVAAIEAILRALPGVTTTVNRSRTFTLTSGEQSLAIACAGAGHIALADMTLVGNEYLAMIALEGLVQLFGPVELAIGDYKDIIDGSEPGAATERYREHMRARLSELQANLGRTRRLIGGFEKIVERRTPKTSRWRLLWIIAPMVVLIGLGFWSECTRKGSVGATCTQHGDCHSGQCMRGPGSRTACTEDCSSDGDCPSEMRCGDAIEREPVPGTLARTPIRACVPASWR